MSEFSNFEETLERLIGQQTDIIQKLVLEQQKVNFMMMRALSPEPISENQKKFSLENLTQITVQKWYNGGNNVKLQVIFRHRDYDNPKFTTGKNGIKKKNGYYDKTVYAVIGKFGAGAKEIPDWVRAVVNLVEIGDCPTFVEMYDIERNRDENVAIIADAQKDFLTVLININGEVMALYTNNLKKDGGGKKMEYHMFNKSEFNFLELKPPAQPPESTEIII